MTQEYPQYFFYHGTQVYVPHGISYTIEAESPVVGEDGEKTVTRFRVIKLIDIHEETPQEPTSEELKGIAVILAKRFLSFK